ncbi:MAG: hypothetical protein Q9M92_01430 [Enterobacterales bacterium]|nr:hypothetical protein [Enterobacterales bacterium]
MIEKEPTKSAHHAAKKTESSAETIDTSSIQKQVMLDSKYELLSGYMDGELTQQEAQKVMLLLEKDPEYNKLYQEMRVLKQEVQSLSFQESELAHLDRLFQEPVAKTSRIFGFALVAIASIILVAFILHSILLNSTIALVIKLAVVLVSLGSLFLLFSVLRQRMQVSQRDKYNRVKL